MISSPRPVHNKITNWFSGWFSLDLKEKKPLHTDEDWLSTYQNKTQYDKQLKDVEVSEEHKTLLWSMLHKYDEKIMEKDKMTLAKGLQTPPTFEDFQAKLQYGKGGHTVGMTELT